MHQTLVLTIRFAFIFLFNPLIGCTKHHQIFLNPSLPIHDAKIGNKIPVSLYVEDSRSSNIISNWEKDLRKFSISSQNDLRETFLIKIRQGLIKLNFSPRVHTRNLNHFLKVEILNIRSKYNERMLRMDIRINIKLRATCSSSIRKYSKTYSAQKYRKNITPATFPNENLINATLSEVLGQILKDQALLDCLIN